jgi:hypothetical protein
MRPKEGIQAMFSRLFTALAIMIAMDAKIKPTILGVASLAH